jgi:hypothetical protein
MISGDQVSCHIVHSDLFHLCYTSCARHPDNFLVQESKRVKFVFYVFVGASANVMAKVIQPICAGLQVCEQRRNSLELRSSQLQCTFAYPFLLNLFQSRVSIHKPDIIKACMLFLICYSVARGYNHICSSGSRPISRRNLC